MTVQQYINDQYRKHLEERFADGENGLSPDEFVEQFDIYEIYDAWWFADPIWDAYENRLHSVYGIDYEKHLEQVINSKAIIALADVDLGELHTVAADLNGGIR